MSSDSKLVHEIITVQYVRSLNALKNILNKAKSHAHNYKFDENKYLDLKLAPDMFNFTKQVQMATDNAKGAAARLTGSEIPAYPDTEKTMEELLARVDKTINYLASFKEEQFSNYESSKATFPWYPNAYLSGRDYLTSFALPNFYFHLSLTYSLLRNAGVQLGKGDYLGEINWKN